MFNKLNGVYHGILRRCYNPHQKSYVRYGARGIKVCDEWLNNRDAFIEWALSHGYSNDLSIDRINNDGIYSDEVIKVTEFRNMNI